MSNINPEDYVGLVKYYVACFIRANQWAAHIADDIYGGCLEELSSQAIRDLYDPDKGSFPTWFKWRIRYAIGKVIDNQITSVTLPRHFYHRNGYLVKSFGLVQDYEKDVFGVLSIDTIAHTDPDDVIRGSDNAKLIRKINAALTCLSDKGRDAIIKYFGLFGVKPKSYAEIAKELGISRQAVEQRVLYALAKLREEIYNSDDREILMGYLEK